MAFNGGNSGGTSATSGGGGSGGTDGPHNKRLCTRNSTDNATTEGGHSNNKHPFRGQIRPTHRFTASFDATERKRGKTTTPIMQ
ncbi:hypothetical protein DMENIID0001_069850 [Sergentomyia squamirostris]